MTYQEWKEKYVLNYTARGDCLISNTWSLGGTYGSCWDDQLHSISAEPQPASFVEFDNLIEKIDPNIGFLKYKKIYNNCVEISTYRDHDYYGGSTENAQFKCDLKKLYNMLEEYNNA